MADSSEAKLAKLRRALEGLFIVRGIKPANERDAVAMVLAWVEDLNDLGFDGAIEAILRFRRESTDYPTPAAVRRYAPGDAGLSAEERSAMAWGLFRAVLSQVGVHRGLEFEDTAMHVAIRAVGGRAKIGEMSSKDVAWLEKLFRSAYEGASRTGAGDHSPLAIAGESRVFVPRIAVTRIESLRVLCCEKSRSNGAALIPAREV